MPRDYYGDYTRGRDREREDALADMNASLYEGDRRSRHVANETRIRQLDRLESEEREMHRRIQDLRDKAGGHSHTHTHTHTHTRTHTLAGLPPVTPPPFFLFSLPLSLLVMLPFFVCFLSWCFASGDSGRDFFFFFWCRADVFFFFFFFFFFCFFC
jgi:hypothetical protein